MHGNKTIHARGGEQNKILFPAAPPGRHARPTHAPRCGSLLQHREGGVGAQHGRNLTHTFRTHVVKAQAVEMVGKRKREWGMGWK